MHARHNNVYYPAETKLGERSGVTRVSCVGTDSTYHHFMQQNDFDNSHESPQQVVTVVPEPEQILWATLAYVVISFLVLVLFLH